MIELIKKADAAAGRASFILWHDLPS